jgi:hypothetical protein
MQCEKTTDCAARGFMNAVCMSNVCQKAPPPPDPVWGCLGHLVAPTPDLTRKLSFTIQFTGLNQVGIAGLTVDVCSKTDVTCITVNPNYPHGLVTDANGNIPFTVFYGFDGYMRISGTNIMDSRVYVGRPLTQAPEVKQVRLLSPNDYQILVAYAKRMVDTTRGTAIVDAHDCSDQPVAGLTFTCPAADMSSQLFYLVNQLPQVPPAATQTDVDGFGGFFNLPTGGALVRAYRASDNLLVGESSFDVLANTISYVLVSPTPM